MTTDTPHPTEPQSNAVSVSEMPWPELRKLITLRGPEIGRLAREGDKLAARVEGAYRYLYDHPGDVKAGALLRALVQDYMHRELLIGELRDLGSRLGHRIDQ
jgi:hypothetical protein